MKVVNRYNLNKTIDEIIHNSPIIFPMGKIIELYHELKPHTCISDEEKLKHINGINLNKNLKTKIIKSKNEEKVCKSSVNKNDPICNEQDKTKQIYQELSDKNPIYKELKEYRLNRSRAENVKPYAIYSNSELQEIIKEKPKTVSELRLIHGFGNVKCNKYGEDITNIVKKYFS